MDGMLASLAVSGAPYTKPTQTHHNITRLHELASIMLGNKNNDTRAKTFL